MAAAKQTQAIDISNEGFSTFQVPTPQVKLETDPSNNSLEDEIGGDDSDTSFIFRTATQFYDVNNDPGNIKYAVQSLLNNPLRPRTVPVNRYYHPRFWALNELINQLKASMIYDQYNYVEISPLIAHNTDPTICKINEPFHALRGIFNGPVARIISEIYRWQMVKCKKDVFNKIHVDGVSRLASTWSRHRNPMDIEKNYSAKSISTIADIFNSQSNKAELLYLNTTVYLRHLKPIELEYSGNTAI